MDWTSWAALGPEERAMLCRIEVADHLDAAAAYIDAHGWTQRMRENAAGEVCAIGAIGRVWPYGWAAARKFGEYLESAGHTDGRSASYVAEWNDRPGRVKEDVTAALQKAAAWTREQV